MESSMSSDAQKKANTKYKRIKRENIVEMRYQVTTNERDIIKNYCEQHNISVSDFTRKLVFDEINKQSN